MGRSLGPVRGAEGVHHEYLAQACVGAGKRFIVLLLSGVESHVFQQGDFPLVEFHPELPVLNQGHLLPQQFGQVLGDGCHGKLGCELALGGTAQV